MIAYAGFTRPTEIEFFPDAAPKSEPEGILGVIASLEKVNEKAVLYPCKCGGAGMLCCISDGFTDGKKYYVKCEKCDRPSTTEWREPMMAVIKWNNNNTP